jgi:hypothetical protein
MQSLDLLGRCHFALGVRQRCAVQQRAGSIELRGKLLL